MRPRRNEWVTLFLEYLVAAIAEGCVAVVGYVGVRLYKRWKRRRKKH